MVTTWTLIFHSCDGSQLNSWTGRAKPIAMAGFSQDWTYRTRAVLWTLVCATFWIEVSAYIPALPTNITPPLYHGSTTLNLTWLNGYYTDVANFIMAGETSTGLDQVCCQKRLLHRTVTFPSAGRSCPFF